MNGGGRGRDTDRHHRDREQHHGEDEVLGRAGDHDDDPFERMELVELATFVGVRHQGAIPGAGLLADLPGDTERAGRRGVETRAPILRGRHHTDHPDVPTEWNGLDAVLGVAAAA